MQPAAREVVQYWTFPASAATVGDFFAATMSLPWCGPPGRGAPKSSTYCTRPTTGKMTCAGTVLAAKATAAPAATPIAVTRKRTPRAVVRWRLIGERALRFALEGSDSTKRLGVRHP